MIDGFVAPDGSTAAFFSLAAKAGYTGVDIFFALSGFLIYGTIIRKAVPYGRFLSRRARRIYPAFLTVLAIYVFLSVVFPAESRIPGQVAAAAKYLVENVLFLPGVLPIRPILTVAWTLSYEFCFYITVPLIVSALGMRGWQPRQRFLFILAGAAVFVALGQAGRNPLEEMMMFAPGMLAFELTQMRGNARSRSPLAEVLTLLFVFGTVGLIASGARLPASLPAQAFFRGYDLYLLFIGLGMLVWQASAPGGAIVRVLTSTPLRVLGTISYSYYLIHGLVLNAIRMILLAELPAGFHSGALVAAALPFALAATILMAALLFVAIEYPYSVKTARGRESATTRIQPGRQPVPFSLAAPGLAAKQEEW